MAVVPHDFGPVFAERGREGIPRAPEEFVEAFGDRAASFTACYRWAHSPGPGELAVALEIDEWGVATGVTVSPSDPALGQVANCVQDSRLKPSVNFGAENEISIACLEKASPAFSALATAAHKRAKSNPGLLPLAAERYQLLLRAHLPTKVAAELEFLLAEVLFDLGRLGEAARHYGQSASRAPDSRWSDQARFNRLLALKAWKDSDSATESVWLDACEAFLQRPGPDRERACDALTSCLTRVGESGRKALAPFGHVCPPAEP